jgi:cytochrome P450
MPGAAANAGICAAVLPLRVVSDLMGIDEADRAQVVHHVEPMVSWADPTFIGDADPLQLVFDGQLVLLRVALETAEARRAKPTDDLISALVQAEVDGDRLTDEEIGAFFILLSVAGTDTTRQAASHALRALAVYPEQQDWLLADFDTRINSAVEEFLRWATPVMTFRRTAVTDTELAGQPIAAGDKIAMLYMSGNFDPEVFNEPGAFDLSRSPNPHLSFGGGGVHFCLGSQLARTQLRAIFRELFAQLPQIQAGEPDYLAGNFIHAVRAMPVTF